MPTSSEPPYLRIVADLRARIESGALRPGDRVPSTRQIARRWRVALATATKALTELRHEGLVRAEPRVGTVVAAPRPRRAPASTGASGAAVARRAIDPERELTRERVVAAAIELADAEGLAAVSMRAVAARLGVATMSPYRHVESKDALVRLMADTAFGEVAYPDPPPEGWRARLELGGRALWTLFRRHPWLAHLSPLSRPLALPSLAVHAEWALAALDELGLAPGAMLDLHIVLYSYVEGLAVNLEREAEELAATGISEQEWMQSEHPALDRMAASGRYPTFARLLRTLAEDDSYDLDLDAIFELGLARLLDGVEVMAARAPRPRAQR